MWENLRKKNYELNNKTNWKLKNYLHYSVHYKIQKLWHKSNLKEKVSVQVRKNEP